MKAKTTFYLVFLFLFSLSIGRNENGLSAQNIITIAGNGGVGYSGDGGNALNATFYYLRGLAVDTFGNVYVADGDNNRIRVINSAGIVNTFAGNGTAGFYGDSGLATNAELNYPYALATDISGNVYIAEQTNNCIRKVNRGDTITTVAGDDTMGFSGDGGLATKAKLNLPHGVAIDSAGNMYIADYGNNRIRKVSPAGIISTFAGNGIAGFSADGGLADTTEINAPTGVSVANGNVYIADYSNNRVRMVNKAGIITTIAGNGTAGYSGDGGLGPQAELNGPIAFAIDHAGNLYITDVSNNRVRMVNRNDTITTAVGNGNAGFAGDQGLPANAELYWPEGIAIDKTGAMYIAEVLNNRVREVTAPLTASITPLHLACNLTDSSSARIKLTGGKAPYMYSWNSGQSNDTATHLSAGTYTVTVTDTADNSTTAMFTVSLPAVLTSVATANTSICAGTCINISVTPVGGTPVYTYSWLPSGATTNTTNVCPSSPTKYTSLVTDANGCITKDSVTISINPSPTVSAVAAQDTVCDASTADLLIGTPVGGVFSGLGVSGTNFDPHSAGDGSHILTYTYTAINGCSNSDSVSINVSSCLGINELSSLDKEVNIYPNPFDENLTAEINTKDQVTLSIFNMLGQNIVTLQVEPGTHTFNTQSLPSGIYMIQIKTSTEELNEKVIKTK